MKGNEKYPGILQANYIILILMILQMVGGIVIGIITVANGDEFSSINPLAISLVNIVAFVFVYYWIYRKKRASADGRRVTHQLILRPGRA